MKNIVVVTIIVLSICSAGLAHGGHDHVMGTVTKVAPGSIQVKTASGETKDVMIDDKTAYTKGGKKASMSDVTEGTRVVIEAQPMQNMLHAESVKIGVTKTSDATHDANANKETKKK